MAESTVCIAFKINGIASGNYLLFNSIIGNNNENTAKSISFYKTHSGIGLYISYHGSYVSVANNNNTLIYLQIISSFPQSQTEPF